MRFLALVFCLLGFPLWQGIAHAEGIDADQKISQKTVHALMEKMKPQLPSGWSLAYDAEFHLISITREAPTAITFIAPNPPPDSDVKPEVGRFSFTLRVLPLLPPVDYQQKNSDNKALEKKMSAIHDRLVKSPSVQGIRGPVMPGTHFLSAVREEQAVIDQYYRLQDEIYSLPDGYFEDISLSWVMSLQIGSYGPTPDDRAVRRECEEVVKKLKQIPLKY